MGTEWFLRSGSVVTGPLSTDQLKAMGAAGRVWHGMEVSKSPGGPWHQAEAVKGLTVLPASTQPQAAPVVVARSGHVTVEKTSKRLKGQQLVAWLVLIGSIVTVMLDAGSRDQNATREPGGLMFGAMCAISFSLVWIIYIRFSTWWNHG